MMNNFADILVPAAMPSEKSGFEPLEWAKQNCPSYITVDAILKNDRYYYRFFFGKEKDLLMFILKWS